MSKRAEPDGHVLLHSTRGVRGAGVRADTGEDQRGQADGRRMTRADRYPFGQQADPSRLIDNPEELASLDHIRALRTEGKGAKAITAALNAERVPRHGWCWHVTMVKSLLTREKAPTG